MSATAAGSTSGYYRLHGLTIRSELGLPEPNVPSAIPDIQIFEDPLLGARPVPDSAEILAELMIEDHLMYRAVQTNEGTVLDFSETCRFWIDEDLSSVRYRPAPGVDREFIGILAAGYLMAFVLALRGSCILHASAVVSGDLGLGIVGSTGMGKSSLAALLCAAGAGLVTDDVLKVDFEAGHPRLVRGSSHLRLREPAWSIVDLFKDMPKTDETADGRLAVYPSRANGAATLEAIIVPRRKRDGALDVYQISDAEALWTLIQLPRIYGWRSSDVLMRSFTQLNELVDRVPVLEVRMPWGPPFSRDLGSRVLEEVTKELRR